LQAVESGVAWTHPDRGDTAIIVWRRESRVVYYRATETAEREALRLASADNGTTFAAICESVAAGSDVDGDAAALINRLLARWLLDGILIRTAK
jgi:hypothetical protein